MATNKEVEDYLGGHMGVRTSHPEKVESSASIQDQMILGCAAIDALGRANAERHLQMNNTPELVAAAEVRKTAFEQTIADVHTKHAIATAFDKANERQVRVDAAAIVQANYDSNNNCDRSLMEPNKSYDVSGKVPVEIHPTTLQPLIHVIGDAEASNLTLQSKLDAMISTNEGSDDSLPFHLQHAITSVDLNVGVNIPTITGNNTKPTDYNGDAYNVQQKLERELADLIHKARVRGYVLTIDLVSNYPPKTGDYAMVPHVRLARGNY